MRIECRQAGFLAALGLFFAWMLAGIPAPAHAQGLQVTEGSISIRALAERQRRMEEAEFLSKLNPGMTVPGQTGMAFQPDPGVAAAAAAAIQNLPPLSVEPLLPKEPEFPANTVLSVYGPEGDLVAEVSQKGDNIAQFSVGDVWAGYTIVGISSQGVAIRKGSRTRTVAVGGRL